MNKIARIEALLFVAGDDGLSIEILSKLMKLSIDEILSLLTKLNQYYDNNVERGLTLIKTANIYRMVTKSEHAKIIKEYAQSPYSQKISQALLETLAIIAYKQPITRIEIEEIRGVQVTGNLKKLRKRKLIKEQGYLNKPGNPILYVTTRFFLDYFGINSLSELPELSSKDNNHKELTDLFYVNYKERLKKLEKN